jgi:hypothetical protein
MNTFDEPLDSDAVDTYEAAMTDRIRALQNAAPTVRMRQGMTPDEIIDEVAVCSDWTEALLSELHGLVSELLLSLETIGDADEEDEDEVLP